MRRGREREKKGGIERVIADRGYVLVTAAYRLCAWGSGVAGCAFRQTKMNRRVLQSRFVMFFFFLRFSDGLIERGAAGRAV